jgi:Ca2+-binding RTX toxin-like protein
MTTVNADKGINTLLLEQLVNIKDGTTGASNESPTTIDYTFGDTTVKTEGQYDYSAGNVNSGLIQQIELIQSSKETIFVIVGAECPIEDLWADAQDGKLDVVPAQIFDGDDEINGSDEDDVLFGWAANDVIFGNKGNDELNGGDGDDDLAAGKGADEQTGGLGADAFIFRKAGDSTVKKSGRDTILDFDRAEGDIIDLAAIDAKTGGKNNAFEFIRKQGFSGDKGELRFKVKDGDALVEGDTNGDGEADFAILVAGVTKLTGDDFEL